MGPHIEFQMGMMAWSYRDFILMGCFCFHSYHFLLQALMDPRFHHKGKRTSATAIPVTTESFPRGFRRTS